MQTITSHNHLLVFGRYPWPGRTKTRLIPTLGPVGAADLQRRLTEHVVGVARLSAQHNNARLSFHYDGGSRTKMGNWLGRSRIVYTPQCTGDLGHRMQAAITDAFNHGARRVVLIGTDIPTVSQAILNRAFDRLKSRELVLGPSTDGGYWLIGMTRPVDVFSGIHWGSSEVLESTIRVAQNHKIGPSLLKPLGDIDTAEDLAQAPAVWNQTGPYLSVIIPTLNEAEHIEATLATAESIDAETIVTDGGSTDATVSIARSHGARIITGAPGRAVQQNLGARTARGRVLLFLHADTHLPLNYVDHVFEILLDPKTAMGAFHFQTDLDSLAMRVIAHTTNLRAGLLGLPYGDQALFLRRRDFDTIGGFPERPIAEDLFLVRRMARHGRIRLAPAAAITSARRWQQVGPLRTTIINLIIAIGCLAGVAPERLATLYRQPTTPHQT